MKRALVCGAGGFIGSHLVKRLKKEDFWVRGVDLKYPEFSKTEADDFVIGDLRDYHVVSNVIKDYNEVYQLACYDDKTEVLTKLGWKFFNSLNEHDEVATLNPKTNLLEYQKILNYISYVYKGILYNFKGKSIDICVTPNHMMYIKRPHKKSFEFIKAELCDKVQYAIQRTMDWEGIEREEFIIIPIKSYRKEVKKIFKFKMDLFLEFLGWYLSEGSCRHNKNKGTYRIHIANTKKENIDRIYDIIKLMGFSPYKDTSTSYGVNFSSQVIFDYLQQFGKCTQKYIPTEIKELSKRQLKILFNSLMLGDGNSDGRAYNTTSKALADDMQEIAIKLGYSTTIGIKHNSSLKWNLKYLVYLTHSNTSKISNYPQKIDYNGIVYCVEVPNHILFVRRNGKAAWCGNCDMGGAGYIFSGNHDADVMHNSAMINLNIAHYAVEAKVKKLFFSSSACMYPAYNQIDPDNPKCSEESAYPANPDSEYGWEKLFSERLYMAFNRNYGLDIRIARFHNIFGTEGTWNNGKEKAPAAICRKVAEAKDNGEIEIWGDGRQTRSFLYIDECLEGIRRLMNSDFMGPVNIGSDEMVTINQLVEIVTGIAGKKLNIKHIDGPLGVRGRNSDNKLIQEKLNWSPSSKLEDGLRETYKWINEKVKERR